MVETPFPVTVTEIFITEPNDIKGTVISGIRRKESDYSIIDDAVNRIAFCMFKLLSHMRIIAVKSVGVDLKTVNAATTMIFTFF